MDLIDWDKYDFYRTGGRATLDNVIQIWSVLFAECGLTGEAWRDLRESLYKYILDEIQHGKPQVSYTLDEMAVKIWSFYRGYMACQQYWDQEMDKLVREIQAKYFV